ncbi:MULTISPECIES: type II toxin-antitoxin system death-on-curing family toxin [unclassified Mesorhizobium]|uniref:type II toxin-antitoxin system death-on-curing family toxin n=1 Tax=unclassified Mesorhizobium TaxID=325217 RepID=UPI0011298F2C|nr:MULTISPECIES: type II toxin-antitoxin system death-on-curing family toxin [unclassified Mesorhizobium]TPI56777.1 type II toxin-antitoxin system death-on-curing family toxin [Mesorhizobium sp. B3-1-1]TPJ55244.1 type II toxin-antitoxin system death-on-curing family toxin [Mesorhizobium sp. B2-6-4]TPJ61947.1 type II toxin-antitoxin system death-on-curing family toxin [Mesorhizobium sp. B2-6-7]TPJ88675.1 type II toxin-antitoxin system death-on-curing family toxin [Mesorhizobium sp. B2-6-3]TPK03
MNWEFLSRRAVEAMHAEQLRRHGGAQGLRDENALESALARAENKANYGTPSIADLAAAYVFGIARNHAFVDGNKRTAIVAAGAFLIVNGQVLTADNGTLYEFVMAIAAGEIDEAGAAAFFRDHLVKTED